MVALSIQIPEELKDRLEAVAARHAVAPNTYILATLERAIQNDSGETKPFWLTATPQERADDFERWAYNHRHGAGLPDEALRRENIYEGCTFGSGHADT